MKKTIYFALLSATLGTLTASAGVDCLKLSLSVKQAASKEQSKVLEIVSTEVAAAPGCACEIVKAAIEGSSANVDTVAAIVEAAAVAAPEQMRLVSQCAAAVAPDALVKIQAVVAKLDPAGIDNSTPNPLDFPEGEGKVIVGPNPGGPGSLQLFPILPIVPGSVINPPVDPDDVTDVNP